MCLFKKMDRHGFFFTHTEKWVCSPRKSSPFLNCTWCQWQIPLSFFSPYKNGRDSSLGQRSTAECNVFACEGAAPGSLVNHRPCNELRPDVMPYYTPTWSRKIWWKGWSADLCLGYKIMLKLCSSTWNYFSPFSCILGYSLHFRLLYSI